jgi:hypothetical protein
MIRVTSQIRTLRHKQPLPIGNLRDLRSFRAGKDAVALPYQLSYNVLEYPLSIEQVIKQRIQLWPKRNEARS